MYFDSKDLERYSLEHAKAGDKVVVVYSYRGIVDECDVKTIKTVSPKRGDVTFEDFTRKFAKSGSLYGMDPYWSGRYSFYKVTPESLARIDDFNRRYRLAFEIKRRLDKLQSNGYAVLDKASYEDLSSLNEALLKFSTEERKGR